MATGVNLARAGVESVDQPARSQSLAGGPKKHIPTTIRGRLEEALSLKERGNEFFGEREWKKAVRKYHHALMYCKGITDKLDVIPGLAAAGGLKSTEEEKREATAITVAVTNNLAGLEMLCDCYFISPWVL